LKGTYGRQVLRINALGFKYREEESELEPTAGQDLYLTLDIEMQKIAEARLRGLGGRPSAIVLIDVRNGEVLVMASAPSFNPNSFVPGISTAEWAKLRDDPMHPMINRAVAHYPPGSVFKPLVAMTALQSGAVDPEDEFTCKYVFRIGGERGRDMHCWRKIGHGPVAMRRSLEQSCNIYYFNLVDHVNVQGIWHAADYLGFGHRTGVEVPWEKEGVNPNDAWKRSTGRSRWTKGDSANYVIGQGYLTASPLQLSRLTAAVANGGKVYRPSLVYAVTNPETGLRERRRSVLVQDLHWKKENLDIVRGGMYDVVHTETGTGRRVRLSNGVRMAGKTGTAEATINGRRGRHAWMTVYAPYENPRYAATMIIEDTQSGGGAMVAPELKALMEGVFSLRGAGS
jgi:penicillin-binding protein 2